MSDIAQLKVKTDEALGRNAPSEAICYLAEWVAHSPDDRQVRTALAVALGDAGNPGGALQILRKLANRLAHEGYLLPAMIAIRHGLERAPNDSTLISTLSRIHVRGQRAKAGDLPVPPPLKISEKTPQDSSADTLLALDAAERLEKVAELGANLGAPGEAAIPLPMPLFSELDEEAFIEIVNRLHYRRVASGADLIVEGQQGDSLLIVASGHVDIIKNGKKLATLGPGTVMGEMALITGAARSATARAREESEIFELSRDDVRTIAQSKPQIAEELVDYCRKRMLSNLLQTAPLFEKFDATARYLLLDRFKRQSFNAGQALIKQGDAGAGLFVIAAGEVEVSVDNDGESVVVAHLGPGDVVGEIALLKEQPTTANVVAHNRVGALFLPRDEFLAILGEHPDVRAYLEGLSDDRLKASNDATEELEVLDADDLIIL